MGIKVSGKVIFTEDISYELKRIRELSKDSSRKFYVYGNEFKEIELVQSELRDFTIVALKETMDSKQMTMFTENTPDDFFVLKYPRIRDIMDRNIEMHQTVLKGYKLVIESHPFLGNRDVYWCYFPWSFFNKSLLGYPHAFAFKNAKIIDTDPFDCSELARRVAPFSETTIDCVFKDINVERIALDLESHLLYKDLKRELFDTESSIKMIIKKLKKFVNTRDKGLKRGLNLLNFNRIYYQYCNGERALVVSNSKVDIYLESEFWKYVENANKFMKTLWDQCN